MEWTGLGGQDSGAYKYSSMLTRYSQNTSTLVANCPSISHMKPQHACSQVDGKWKQVKAKKF